MVISSFLFILLLLSACHSVEQLSIDYMQPAEVSFPATLKKVAIVNNVPNTTDSTLVSGTTFYYHGDAPLTTEALAEAIAQEGYFDEVVVCDSALRHHDATPRETLLLPDEVEDLAQNLGVDFIIALEEIQLSARHKMEFIPEWRIYSGTIDVKVHPNVCIYIPGRRTPMVTVHATDSIFWEEAGTSEQYVRTHLIDEKELIEQASLFAGSVPVKHLLPTWKTGERYLFSGGSVNMRDGAVYAREENWEEAVRLWQETYEKKKGKQRIMAAYNLALGYEMQDNISEALEWAQKAQELLLPQSNTDDSIYYILISQYIGELQQRKEGMTRLNAQMQRFNEDF